MSILDQPAGHTHAIDMSITHSSQRVSRARITDTFFYALEKSIKAYRQFAQTQIDASGVQITIDQWLVLKALQDHPEATQQQIGTMVFKDFASITRIIQLLVAKGFVSRSDHSEDGRRSALTLSRAGDEAIAALEPIIRKNRRRALQGTTPADVAAAHALLEIVATNCQRREIA